MDWVEYLRGSMRWIGHVHFRLGFCVDFAGRLFTFFLSFIHTACMYSVGGIIVNGLSGHSFFPVSDYCQIAHSFIHSFCKTDGLVGYCCR